jgi:hypothetical protein
MIVTETGVGGRCSFLREHLQALARVEYRHREVCAADVKNGQHGKDARDVEERQG